MNCPLPTPPGDTVTLAHGGGGRLTNGLIEDLMIPAFGRPPGGEQHDGALLPIQGSSGVAFTTDCHVVDPLFFPGGDIGSLSIIGTVNDLAMCGAVPKWISAGFILEEGLSMSVLRRVVASMATAAANSDVRIVTGDTKVVNRGKGDGIYICTSGVGQVIPGMDVRPKRVTAGDAVLVSGDIGRHGISVLACREGISLELTIESDLAPLTKKVLALADAGVDVHCMRDLTRGGLAAALNEIATASSTSMTMDEAAIPVADEVAGACEILGLDPLQSACEGRFVLFTPHGHAQKALKAMGTGATLIGVVDDSPETGVFLRTTLGTTRVLEMPSGMLLPRIC
ncbi:MAG: hydrogenase expression/formation protein HypE [Candidatus Fermentibacteraceae bacterium]